jgi:hypothetical protein
MEMLATGVDFKIDIKGDKKRANILFKYPMHASIKPRRTPRIKPDRILIKLLAIENSLAGLIIIL